MKEKRDKEDRELKEQKDKEDRVRERELRDALEIKQQADRDLRKAEIEAMLTRDKIEREERDKLRDDKEIADRKQRLEELERDRVFRELRYKEERDERLAKDNRKDIRLKRATESMKGRFSEQPTDLKSMITFFKSFESAYFTYAIDEDLKVPIFIPYLNARSKQLVLALVGRTTFEQVKVAILLEFNFTPRMYQSAFLDSFRSLGESAVQFVSRLPNSLELYLDSRGINKSYDKLVELLISDRYRNTLDEETRHYVADHEHDGWMLPKRMAQLIDLYQSERHPNWNYLKNPKNFTGKTGNTAYKSSSYQYTAGSKHTFIRYDKTRMFCTYCKGKGQLKFSCYKLTRSEKPDNSKKEVKERRCYVCDSKFHLAPKCPEKKQGKTFNAKRVTVDSVSQNFSLPNRSIDNKIFQFNDLLNSMNVTDSMERIVFQPIDIKNDVRVNSVTGVYGFIPSGQNNACVGLNAEVGGIALHDQVEGIDRDELGQLELDDDHVVRHEDGSEVAAGLWGGGLSSGIGRDLNNLFENDVGVSDTDTKSMHTTNMIKHNKEHVVNVVFDGQKIPMLIDSGTQISVIRSKLIPHSIISNDSTNQIHLLGAFGKPVSATVIPITAVLSDDNSTGLSNRSSKILHIALCDELNGDTGLLSINDFNILCGRGPFISNVKVMSNSDRICLDCKKVDKSKMIENDTKVISYLGCVYIQSKEEANSDMLHKGIGREIEYDYNTDDDEVNKVSILNLDLSIGSLIRKKDDDLKLLHDGANNKSESQHCYDQLKVNQLDLSEEMYRQLNYVHNDSCYDNIRKSIGSNEFITNFDDNELKYEVETCSCYDNIRKSVVSNDFSTSVNYNELKYEVETCSYYNNIRKSVVSNEFST